MTPSSATIQNVTNASGTVAIASSSTSIGVSKVVEGVTVDPILIDQASSMVNTADMIALASLVVLTLSFIYNMYATRKQRTLDERIERLRAKEYDLELAKFKMRNLEQLEKNHEI